MSLNIKSSLEIVKRAGYGSGAKIASSKSERRMADGQRTNEEEPWLAEEQIDPIRAADTEALDEAFEQIDLHRNPENMTHEQLLDINDL